MYMYSIKYLVFCSIGVPPTIYLYLLLTFRTRHCPVSPCLLRRRPTHAVTQALAAVAGVAAASQPLPSDMQICRIYAT
jgi:hypothetical protein